jgi:hypothetical protein
MGGTGGREGKMCAPPIIVASLRLWKKLLWVGLRTGISESVIPTAEPSRQAGSLVNYDAELCVQLQNELKFTHARPCTCI